MHSLIKSFVNTANVVDKTNTEVKTLLTEHISPKPTLYTQRLKFYRMVQKPSEPARVSSQTAHHCQWLQVQGFLYSFTWPVLNGFEWLLDSVQINSRKNTDTCLSCRKSSKSQDFSRGTQIQERKQAFWEWITRQKWFEHVLVEIKDNCYVFL